MRAPAGRPPLKSALTSPEAEVTPSKDTASARPLRMSAPYVIQEDN
jgi:hypothetical protein